ncbi:UDP-3-O-acyl-N-acetylglucosamine deacetylase [Anabaena cylindrica FACHB-243]|uniref:UDP-3-O-acyl-N-acetylglucosamine deacetylase n=1 Tax=Anabaena cylindrica (strain ATCC 27899 / PCC 7122) TaxID=272123 RepID=K9ZJD4_ANACC|nr:MULTISPECIES: UDP-3-O-acyl-N-acetylglucosamine deacetylase [Anabaena]AFZ59338.1 UDP-3-O-(3-hydroxymyristoyl) N-acetylglucosamine deacetylase [Anabaena cylindrica PCC 7122]MBD2416800.1 UDP-3-O-acyl-N-acetylglucosamine deacetylase [Anabaena cylindrica FACHB-243]MBY5280276.1 UDP-3-O-acyl-N-acetylglucosamine deacetylase [Anabaena sp. CCAP 1446/1C]MBY5310236.1 UDP-3-O-acyl-N-acetylglucosamine deacetylase [Anabaena sp. CCAP 1446/1C]MCM2405258.1 UDP-3-O-acyl-N-acetylglucosamine deacetylase [Anabae
MHQHTLAAEITQTGVGLHSGVSTHVRILPAEVGSDRYFVRVDLPNSPIIPAQVAAVSHTMLSTQLGEGDVSVRTVEHLLAALAAMGVDNARIEIDGPEVPLLDGSAQIWVESIAAVGLVSQPVSNTPAPITIQEPIWVYHGDAFVCALPAAETRFTYGIDFELPAIGNQWYSYSLITNLETAENTANTFITEIAPARTFGLLHQIEHLQQSGLIKGGSLDNALVCGSEGWLNPPLRFANEPVRHKILDLVGDMSLLGKFPVAHFLAYKASHNLHVQLAQKILELNPKLTKI